MKVAQKLFKDGLFTQASGDELSSSSKKLVLGFGSKLLLQHDAIFNSLQQDYPVSDIVLCSTTCEISPLTPHSKC